MGFTISQITSYVGSSSFSKEG